MDIATEKKIVIKVAGKKRTVTTTAQTVAEALAEAKIAVDGDDKVSVAKTTALVDGAKFSYTRVDVKRVTKKQKVAYGTVRKESSKLTKGVTKIDNGRRQRRPRRDLPGRPAQRQDHQPQEGQLQDHQEARRPDRPGRHQGAEEQRAERRPRAASGTRSPSASPAATGRSTPATASTAGCSSP